MSGVNKEEPYDKAFEKWKVDISALSNRHDTHHFEINGSINGYAHLGIKSLYLLNGGAISLIPIYISALKIPPESALESFNFVVLPFLFSILLTACCNFFAYFTEAERAEATSAQFDLEYKEKEDLYFSHFHGEDGSDKIKESIKRLRVRVDACFKTWSAWRNTSIVFAIAAFASMLFGFFFLVSFVLVAQSSL